MVPDATHCMPVARKDCATAAARGDYVAIGTDFDGFTDPPTTARARGELPVIREMLDQEGIPRQDAEAVLGGNARRVLRNGGGKHSMH
jgi:microsomal dipeptidase-like Zn-dependent dipeptidase